MNGVLYYVLAGHFVWIRHLTLLRMLLLLLLDSSWNVMGHGDAREGKRRGNWRMEWVASTLHTTSEHGVSSITSAYAYTSAASSRLNWRPFRFKWTRPFSRKTKSGLCACAIIFQLASTTAELHGGSNMTGTNLYVNKCKQSRSYLNHLVFSDEVLSYNLASMWINRLQLFQTPMSKFWWRNWTEPR